MIIIKKRLKMKNKNKIMKMMNLNIINQNLSYKSMKDK